MQKWEYIIEETNLRLSHTAKSKMDMLGKDGWELIGIYQEDDVWYAVYKRPKEE